MCAWLALLVAEACCHAVVDVDVAAVDVDVVAAALVDCTSLVVGFAAVVALVDVDAFVGVAACTDP